MDGCIVTDPENTESKDELQAKYAQPALILSWGVLRRTPQTPSPLRGSESRSRFEPVTWGRGAVPHLRSIRLVPDGVCIGTR